MEASTIAIVVLFILVFVEAVLIFLGVLALGGLAQNHRALKSGVDRMAEAADNAFASDRFRISQVERFLVVAFKLDELLLPQKQDEAEPSLRDQVSPKKSDLKN